VAALALILVLLALAIEAHLRARQPKPAELRGALWLFLGGTLLQRFAFRAIGDPDPGSDAGFSAWVLLDVVFGIAAVAGVLRLLACGAKRRDLVWRGVLGALSLAAAAASVEVSAVIACVALFSFRWTRQFSTRPLLGLGLLFLGVFVLGVRAPSFDESAFAGLAVPCVAAGRWTDLVARFYLVLGVLALFRAFIRDPSLGIRTVGRRLALSHVLVVLVPLLLLGLLWTFTTILGVNTDRAMVAARALESEGHQLRLVLADVLSAGADAPRVARSRLAGRGRDWSAGRVWLREGGEWRRVAGDSIAGEARFARWLDSLAVLPAAGVVGDAGRGRYGAAMLDPADSSRGAVVMVDADSLLRGAPARVAEARLALTLRDLVARGGSITTVGGERSPGAPGRAPGAVLSRADSVEIERARRIMRRLGLPDSVVSTNPRASGLTLNAAGDTLRFSRPGVEGGNLLVDGHALVPCLSWTGTRWRKTRALLSSRVEPGAAVAGLYRNLRENPITALPVLLILGLTVLVLLVAIFDFVMVAGLARSITAAIRALQGGAARLEAGDLAHRIDVRGADDLWSVAGAFNQAVAGFERSRELELERTRLENELELARQIQARLLPAGPPRVAGFEIAGYYDPALQVGGDYFDHLEAGEGRVLLVIADVSGKGVPASLLMSGFRASLMSQDLATGDPVALSGHLNDFLLRSVEMGKFVTAFLAFADSRTGTLDYVNAGHNPPVLLRSNGSHTSLEAGGLMFGVLPGAPYAAGHTTFGPGDLLVLYTDGVTEGASVTHEQWGDERLLAAVRRGAARPCSELVRGVAEEVRTFEGEQGPADDITLLVARRV
jgi:serine phosphatase RsbU (regulator of sigma subunit)